MSNTHLTGSTPVSDRTHAPTQSPHRRMPTRVAAMFVGIGLAWVWVSDLALVWLSLQSETGFLASVSKGSLFILLAALIVYWLVRYEIRSASRSAALLNAVAEGTTDAVFVKDRAGRYLLLNAAAARFAGKPVEAVLGRDDTALFDPASAQTVRERDRRVMEAGIATTEEEVLTSAGVPRTYLATKAPYRDADGTVIGVIGIARDITDRKREAVFLARQNAILERVAAGEALARVLEDLVRLIEAQDPGTLGSILLLDGKGRLRLGSAPSLPPEYNAAIDNMPIGPCVGSCGTAAYTRKSVFVGDIETDPRWAEYATLALSHGLKACWSVPIFAAARGGEPPAVLGTFAIYARTARAPAQRLVELLGRVGQLASIAIESDRAANELRESEARFRVLVEHATDGIFLHNEQGVVLDVNECGYKSLGYAREELIGKTPADFDATATPDEMRNLSLALDRGEVVAFDGVHRRKDGSTFPVEVRIRPFLIGSVRYGLAMARDITDRKRAEETLRESEERLQLALNAGRLGIWEWNVPSGEVFWSADSYSVMGVLPDQFGGTLDDFKRLVHPEDRSVLWDKVAVTLAAEGPAFEHEFRIVRGDGGVRWVINRAKVTRDSRGQPARMTGVVADITDRRVAEEARVLLAAIVESSDDAIYSMNLAGVIRTWNAGAERLFGYTAGEAVGKPIAVLMAPERLDEEDRILTPINDGERFTHFDTVRLTKDGRRIDVSLTISPIRDANGRVIGASKVARDITDRKRAEETLRESEGRLAEAQRLARLGSWRWEPATGRVWWSDALYEVFGVSRGDVLPSFEAFLTRLHPDDRPRAIRRAKEVVEGAGGFSDELRIIRPDGELRWIHSQARTVRDAAKGTLYVEGTDQDVTEQKHAEAALRESEGRLRLFVEHAPAALAMFDRDMRYLVASRQWVSDYLPLQPEFVGRSHYDFYPDLPAKWRAAHARGLAGEVVHAERDFFQQADGTAQWLWWEVRPWYDAAGAIAGIVIFAVDITASVRAEVALRESEEQFRTTFEQAAVGIAHVGLDGQFLRVNERYEAIAGYGPGELVGRTFQVITHPDDLTADLEFVGRLLAGDIPHYSLERRYLRKSGGEVWVNLTVSLRQDAAGTPLYLIAVIEDITQRRDAEEAVRESEARFRNLIEFLPDAIFLNVDGRVVFCNPACARLFAADLDQLLGKTPFDLLHQDDHDAIRQRIARMDTTGDPVPAMEERVVRLDGATTPVSVTATPIRDAGRPAFLVVLRDLTEQKRMEAQLRQQDLMIREAGELAHVGGWGFDPATGQGDWTEETARIHGLPLSGTVTVQDGLSFYAGEDRTRIEAAVAAATAHGTPYDMELRLTAKCGAEKWVRTICRPIVEDGRVVRVRGSFQDITDKKRTEEEIRALNAELEQRVRDRTAELEAVNRELESFSYSVSHDLRAPIRHINGFTSIVLEACGSQLPAANRQHLEQVAKAAHRMGQLVDDLLAFSRLGRQPLRRELVNTRRLVEECLREVVGEGEGRIETRVGDLPSCTGDAALLRQVWLNLLSNAVKYSGKRDPAVIEVGTTPTPDGIAYFIKDNGAGFDMRYAHKLFGVFQRLHKSEEFEGTGIGLALVQRIIHRHGGRVWAEAAPDKGATFWFTPGPPG